jgi:hypothetical protein
VLPQVQCDHGLDRGALLGVETPTVAKMVSQRPSLVTSPRLEGGHELALVDQANLKGEQSEEQISVSGKGGHGAGLPRARHGRCAVGPRRRGPAAVVRWIGWIIS